MQPLGPGHPGAPRGPWHPAGPGGPGTAGRGGGGGGYTGGGGGGGQHCLLPENQELMLVRIAKVEMEENNFKLEENRTNHEIIRAAIRILDYFMSRCFLCIAISSFTKTSR